MSLLEKYRSLILSKKLSKIVLGIGIITFTNALNRLIKSLFYQDYEPLPYLLSTIIIILSSLVSYIGAVFVIYGIFENSLAPIFRPKKLGKEVDIYLGKKT